jgi:putative lipoic acid-binding regulatory protein
MTILFYYNLVPKVNLQYSVMNIHSEVITLQIDNVNVIQSFTKKVTTVQKRVVQLIVELRLDDITARRALIRASCRDRYPTVTLKFITNLFWQYDTIFLNNFIAIDFRAMKYRLEIKVESIAGNYAGCVTFKGKNFKLSINSDYAKIVPFNKRCESGYDRLGHVMRTIEHEIVHILHLTHPTSDKSQAHHGTWFNVVNKQLFAHDRYKDD